MEETRLLYPFQREMAFLPWESPMLTKVWSAAGCTLESAARCYVWKRTSDRFQEWGKSEIAAVGSCLEVIEPLVTARSRPAVQSTTHL